MNYENTLAFAKMMDSKDPLKKWREQFYMPVINRKEVLYFTGNSLGLQPKKTRDYIEIELEDWEKWGVEGHFKGRNPWVSYHEMFAHPVSRLVGGMPKEVVVMNNLTVNLNLLLVSFYRPTKERYKIICESNAFPSDQYALEMQVKCAGFDPQEAIIEVAPRHGEHIVREDDIVSAIQEAGSAVALVIFGGVNYLTGQVFDMELITKKGHEVGAMVGFDLAHAVGNVQLELHKWEVDFACWCSYKYLNSGPGGVSGVFVNEKHCNNTDLPRFAGWWGHDKESRFLMENGFKPMKSAESWQMSNAPVLSMAAHKASIDIFDEVGMTSLLQKQRLLSGFLEFIIEDINEKYGEVILENITPREWDKRGCQISIIAHNYGKPMFDKLTEEGVIVDWREPNVIRMAPVPLYNSFEDVYRFGEVLMRVL